MTGKLCSKGILIALLFCVSACGGLRFSQLDPAAENYHPRRIAIFSTDVGTYEEARPHIDQIVAGVLVEKKWFEDVIDAPSLQRQTTANPELRKAMLDYLSKLHTLNFSDAELSKEIGEVTKTDAFLLVSLDFWNYTTEKDKKIARVGMAMRLIDAPTGKIMWKAGHTRDESYMLIKPALPNVARSLAAQMVGYMPR